MPVRISTHNGSQVAREHNIRNEKVVSREEHIDLNGEHEIWIDEKPRDAYERLFGESLRNYNAKQTREDRKIKNYYNSIKNDAKKHTVYEMIIGVYGKDENGYTICDKQKGKEIMQKFIYGGEDRLREPSWQDRNPNLELIGAYYHADEQGEPHLHIDYVPVAHESKRGLETQTALVRAYEEMGIKKRGPFTAQIQWEGRENKLLTHLCEERGLEVEHPREENRQHIETELYKAEKSLESAIDNTKDLMDIEQDLAKKRDITNTQYIKAAERKRKLLTKHKTKDKENYICKKSVIDELKDTIKSMKDDAIKISHTDKDLQIKIQEVESKKTELEEKIKKVDYTQKQVEKLKEKQQDLILDISEEKAQEKFDKFKQEYIAEPQNNVYKRLVEHCRGIKYNDGTSVLDEFNQAEKERKKQIDRQWDMSR